MHVERQSPVMASHDRLAGLSAVLHSLGNRAQPVERIARHLMVLDIHELWMHANRYPDSLTEDMS